MPQVWQQLRTAPAFTERETPLPALRLRTCAADLLRFFLAGQYLRRRLSLQRLFRRLMLDLFPPTLKLRA